MVWQDWTILFLASDQILIICTNVQLREIFSLYVGFWLKCQLYSSHLLFMEYAQLYACAVFNNNFIKWLHDFEKL